MTVRIGNVQHRWAENHKRYHEYQHQIIEKPKLMMVDAVDYQRFVDKWDDNIKKAKNGILFFDNVQKLLPDKYSNQVNPLDKLFVEMDKWEDNPIVIISGLTKGLEDFLERSLLRYVRWTCALSMVSQNTRLRQKSS